MKRTIRGHVIPLAMFLFLISLISCGIDEYVYLEPISSVTISSSDSQKITVNLPSSQSIYFDEYLIYYRIYPSTSASTANSLASSNWSTIYNANLNYPATLETVIKNLSFKTISFAQDTQNSSIVTLNSPLKSSNISANSITSFVIDFNAANRVYPCLIVGDTNKYYRLLRNPDLNLDDQYKDILYYNTITYSTITSDPYKDYYSFSGYTRTGYPYAHIQLIAVATGHDSSFSSIYSTACQLGVFQLSDATY